MINEHKFVFTNVRIFYAIAKESLEEMRLNDKKFIKPKPDSIGKILIHDPKRKSFKSALTAIVFSGICLDALLHQQVVQRLNYDESQYKKVDHKEYEKKLILLGCKDSKLLDHCKHFRECRKELVHEKAHFDKSQWKVAQKEAEKSLELLDDICRFLNISLN